MSRNSRLESLRKKLTKVAPADLESLVRDRGPVPINEAALESLPGARDGGEIIDSLVTSTDDSAEAEASALRKLSNGDFGNLSPREELQLEAIIEEEGRQVSFVLGGTFEELPHPWTHFNDAAGPIRRSIESAIPSIGRVEALPRFPGGAATHLGTGFIVGPNLMMTNRHVARLFVRGVGRNRRRLSFVPQVSTALDFRRERDPSPADATSNFAISDVVMVHPFWDMAMFRVEGLPHGMTGLNLSVLAPEDLRDREIAVIGYPGPSRDRSRKAVELERKYFGTIFGVKRLAPGEIRERERIESFEHMVNAMTHDSSTLPGNSGAAILDVTTGEIVGLHFAGITLRANYSVPMFELARDRRVVDAGLNFRQSIPPTQEWESYWILAEAENELAATATQVAGAPNQVAPLAGNNAATWTVPLTISVSLGAAPRPAPPAIPSAVRPASPWVEASFQIPIIHPDLDQRMGYNPDFLELAGRITVPLPELTDAGKEVVSRLADGTFELKYHKFSVVMHKLRRMALFTASNVNWIRADRLIDGHKPTRAELTGIPDGVLEEWVMDDRIPEPEQLPDLFFTKDQGKFDKGHLVRRDDVAWGPTFEDMQKGNGDTYHTTNCSPQVSKFNQAPKGDDNWGDLENMIQSQTRAEKVNIFSGSVLSETDRIFKGIDESGLVRVQIPEQFWKIIVAGTEDGPRAFGFVLKQRLVGVPLEFTVPEDWEPFQTPIREIEELLFGLINLDWFKAHDALDA